MKKKKFMLKTILILLLFVGNIFAQDYIINLKYASELLGNSYSHNSEISLDAMLPFFENTIESGIYAGDITSVLVGDYKVNGAVIQKTFAGLSFYYNPFKKIKRTTPFIGLKSAYLFMFLPDPKYPTSGGSTPYYPGFYNHYTENDYMAVLSLGAKIDIFDSESKDGQIILGVDYQIRKFDLYYMEFYEIDDSDYLGIRYHSEELTLSSFLWSIGLQLNLEF